MFSSCLLRSSFFFLSFSLFLSSFLVACTRLYKPLCRSVRRSVGPSVRRSVGRSVCHTLLFFRKVGYRVACARLMAIDLVFSQLSSAFLRPFLIKCTILTLLLPGGEDNAVSEWAVDVNFRHVPLIRLIRGRSPDHRVHAVFSQFDRQKRK